MQCIFSLRSLLPAPCSLLPTLAARQLHNGKQPIAQSTEIGNQTKNAAQPTRRSRFTRVGGAESVSRSPRCQDQEMGAGDQAGSSKTELLGSAGHCICLLLLPLNQSRLIDTVSHGPAMPHPVDKSRLVNHQGVWRTIQVSREDRDAGSLSHS